jgi:hypothetical protein
MNKGYGPLLYQQGKVAKGSEIVKTNLLAFLPVA